MLNIIIAILLIPVAIYGMWLYRKSKKKPNDPDLCELWWITNQDMNDQH